MFGVKRVAIFCLISVLFGVASTLLSGFFKTPFTRIGVDVVFLGAPFAWVIKVIPMPAHYLWDMLLADIILWALPAFIVIMVLSLYLQPRNAESARRRPM